MIGAYDIGVSIIIDVHLLANGVLMKLGLAKLLQGPSGALGPSVGVRWPESVVADGRILHSIAAWVPHIPLRLVVVHERFHTVEGRLPLVFGHLRQRLVVNIVFSNDRLNV